MEIVEPYPYSESDSIQLFSSLPVIGYPPRERREDREKWRMKIKFIRILCYILFSSPSKRRRYRKEKHCGCNWIISMLRAGVVRFPAKLLSRRGKKDMPRSLTPGDGEGICGISRNGSGEFVDSRIPDPRTGWSIKFFTRKRIYIWKRTREKDRHRETKPSSMNYSCFLWKREHRFNEKKIDMVKRNSVR